MRFGSFCVVFLMQSAVLCWDFGAASLVWFWSVFGAVRSATVGFVWEAFWVRFGSLCGVFLDAVFWKRQKINE